MKSRSPGRVRPLLVAVMVAGAAGGAAWWRAAHAATAPEAFAYLHGALASPASSGEVVFRQTGTHGLQTFTLAQLRALPAVRYRATQPQLRRSFVYTGVPLRDLAELAGLSGRNLRIAGDDLFAATLRASDYRHFPVMLAYLADGQPLTAAQKGPLLVVFPNEQHPDRFSTFNSGSQWVWFATQLAAAP